jgi:hypothetical protein
MKPAAVIEGINEEAGDADGLLVIRDDRTHVTLWDLAGGERESFSARLLLRALEAAKAQTELDRFVSVDAIDWITFKRRTDDTQSVRIARVPKGWGSDESCRFKYVHTCQAVYEISERAMDDLISTLKGWTA